MHSDNRTHELQRGYIKVKPSQQFVHDEEEKFSTEDDHLEFMSMPLLR